MPSKIKAIVSDFSKVILSCKDKKLDKTNILHEELIKKGDYPFWEYFVLNQELLNFYEKIGKEFPIYIFTTRYIQEYPPCAKKLEPYFQKTFIADQLNLKKSTPESYLQIAKLLELLPEEILFIDDTEKNIQAAESANLKTIRHKNNAQTFQKVMEILEN